MWPSILMFAVGTVATLGVWTLSQAYRTSEAERMSMALANSVRQLVEVRFDYTFQGLVRLAHLWSNFEARDPDAWKADAQMFMRNHDAVVYLERLSPADAPEPDSDAPAGELPQPLITGDNDIRAWLETAGNASAREAGRKQAAETRTSVMVGPFEAPTTHAVYEIFVPLDMPGKQDLLMGVVDGSRLLEPLVTGAVPGYAVEITDGDMRLHGNSDFNAASARSAETNPIVLAIGLSVGREWRLTVARDNSLPAPLVPPFGTAVFASGIGFSILLGTLVHLGQLSRVRARALAQANHELQTRVDATEQAEAEIRRLNETLEQRITREVKARDDVISELETFNYSVSHDLRSPLGAIVNFTAILSEDHGKALDDEARDILKRMSGCAQTAVSMMDDLLAFSHIGQQKLALAPVDMAEQVRGVFSELVVSQPAPVPSLSVNGLTSVRADPSLMRLVWSNLLSNAVKFTRGQPNPAIEVGSRSTEDEEVYFVRDNGVGFDMQHATRLFRVFERLHAKQGFAGHGVGLAIVSRIVQRHGGRAWAQAAPDKGATFFFSIPRRHDHHDTAS